MTAPAPLAAPICIHYPRRNPAGQVNTADSPKEIRDARAKFSATD